MKIKIFLIIAVALLAASCLPKKPEKKENPHAEKMPQEMENPHATSGPGLDVDALVGSLPQGWKKEQPSSSMRLAQVVIPLSAGDEGRAEIAIFHFPGTGGSASANILRWQGQMKGPNGEPGAQVAKTDTLKMKEYTIITTDVTGTLLASTMGTGPSSDVGNSRMIASVIETPGGNWFVKATGPQKTIAAQETNFRNWVKTSKLKG